MAELLKELAVASAIGMVLWLILLCFRPLTRRLFSQTWHYYTGLIPALFLFGLARIVALLIQFAFKTLQISQLNIGTFNATVETMPTFSQQVIPEISPFFNTDAIIEAVEKTTLKHNLSFEMFVPYLFFIWVVGCLIFLLWKSAAYMRFRRMIFGDSVPSEITCCPLSVVVSPNTSTPMLVGVIKPVIILPDKQYDEQELSLILAHETTHWKRGDLLVKFVLLCVNAVHWFNPFAYILNRDAINLCETACDETLARHMNRTERLRYGEMLLSTAEYGASRRSAYSAGMSYGNDLKLRLMYMMKFKKTKLPTTAFSVIISLVITISGGFITYAMPKTKNTPVVKNYEFTASDYTVQELYRELPSGIEKIPNILPIYDAAAIAAKTLTEFYGLDLNGKTLYLTYKEPVDGHLVMPGEERDPNAAILSSAKWNASVFFEDDAKDGTGWEYRVAVSAGTGELWEVTRSYVLSEGLYFDFVCTQDDYANNKWIAPHGMMSSSGNDLISYVDMTMEDSTITLIKYINSENEYTALAKSVAERNQILSDIATVKCVGLQQFRTQGYFVDEVWVNGDWLDNYVVDVLVTSSDGTRVLLSFLLDTKEFLWASFEPSINHFSSIFTGIL